MKTLVQTKNLIFDAIFPKVCVCGKWGDSLCPDCLSTIPTNKTQLCPVCKKLSENGKTCPVCRHKSNLTGVMVFGDHEDVLKDAIWQYKYNFIRDLAKPLSDLCFGKFGSFLEEKNFLITYVPIAKNRLNWRGFNQSQLLAEILAQKTDLEIDNLFFRVGKSKTQVGLTRKNRVSNLKDKISLNESLDLRNVTSRRTLIIDDVYTTGTTLEECAKKLRETGVKEIWGLVLSRD